MAGIVWLTVAIPQETYLAKSSMGIRMVYSLNLFYSIEFVQPSVSSNVVISYDFL